MADIDNVGMEEFLNQLIKRRKDAVGERDKSKGKAEAVLRLAKEAGRERLNDDEDAEFRQYTSDMKKLGAEIEGLDERIQEVSGEIERSGQLNKNLQNIRAAEQSVVRVKEQATYRKGDPRRSYMQDLIRMQLNMDTDGQARDRLMRHAQDVATLPEYAEYRDLSRTDGSGGYAIPPAWLMDQYVALARPGRAFANLVNNQALPAGTDSINIPKLLTGTATGVQTADNAAVTQVDLTDTFINAPVRTIAGQQALAIQLIDQSPIAFDDVVFRDLVADYAAQVDRQVLNGSGSSGQVLGVNNTSNIQTVAVGAVTIAGVYAAIANAIQKVHTSRYLPPDVIVMHPRRWGWFLSLLDGQQRPLFLPAANGPMNVAGVVSNVESQQVVGQMHGLPVVTDPNIGTTFGAQTPTGTEDVIYVIRASDIVLWESGIRARVLPETKAQNLTVLLQIYGYLAFSAARYPQSIVEITGLTPPTF